ncbi:sperm flagellar protein 1 isoform X1 [Carassius auratus]|uniref:Sperm flagellar protein 1 isoform X1 n=2 Tax=Carassius auratus TaxID=7957 RepID=A0A6P6NE89_CARAU|nr:sperm flagellar protein 1-like isoform X1 [Carassius auratus]XP_052469045.1 sperm flagellar protein 1 [Carassius gibelio]
MDGLKQLNEEALQDLYAWIDKIPLSRPKRNITRDFSDGVMAAEVVKHFFPKLVDLHNYTAAHSTQQKLSNWSTLNRKVFSKLNFHVPEETMKKIVVSTAGCIELVLCSLREKIEEKQAGKQLDGTQDLEYYSTINGQPRSVIEATHTNPATVKKIGNVSPAVALGPNVDPAVRLLLEEKEQAILALQETVEILQIKVDRLEHLVHLKDLRIEDLTKHLERYKAHNS